MTQEEKAKAYDEALKKLHEIITMDNHPVLPKEIGEFLFPQLTESEDERIRKELLEEIEFIIPHEDETDSEGLMLPSYRTRISKYRSYLEKQKEQKSIEDAAKEATKDKESAENFLETAGIIDESGNLAEIYRSEQGPAEWSEEEIRTIFDDYAESRDTYTSCINRLKSLRPQPHWKPSEE